MHSFINDKGARDWRLTTGESVTSRIVDGDGNPYSLSNLLPVDVGGNIQITGATIEFRSDVSTSNSFTGSLAAGAGFTGQWEEVKNYAGISVIALTTAASAMNGAMVQFSHNGSDVLRSVAATIPSGTGQYFSMAPEAQYFRLVYLNGASSGEIKSQTLLRFNPPAHVELPLGATVTDLNLASMHRSMMSARLSNGLWMSLESTPSRELKVNATQSSTWSLNNISGLISLPQGAATSVLQSEASALLSGINSGVNIQSFGGSSVSFGQQNLNNSIPVAIATNQNPISVYTRVTGEFARIVRKEVFDFEEMRFDIPVAMVNASTYVGVSTDGLSTATSGWNIVRTYFDSNGNPNRQRMRTGLSWDNRTGGW